MKPQVRLGPLWFLLLFFALCLPAYAQRNTGTIVGLITDSTGAAIGNAAITVTNVDTGVIRTQASELSGNYRVVSLPPGRYRSRLRLLASGRKCAKGLPSRSTRMLARLCHEGGPGRCFDHGNGRAPLINTESGELGTTLDSQQVEDLPSLNRNILAALPLLSPGVGVARQQFDNDPPLRFSVNGGRALSEDMVGTARRLSRSTLRRGVPSSPTRTPLQEMKFQTNAYAAENGRGPPQ